MTQQLGFFYNSSLIFYPLKQGTSISKPPSAAFLHTDKNGNTRIDIHVMPNASKTTVYGLSGEAGKIALKLRLNAPPVDGKANAALIKWMANTLGVSQRSLELVRGETSRHKQLAMLAETAERADWSKLMAMLEAC
ncbi:hypothetical protein HC248_02792 [Polaromonas vacuolata]|uniref:UPF0235 protein HC248_02792 n=1 Tax=Polaromonas vacuolata TaxID=37448 RepID=A0A6H2HCE3_9BURK|nr:DUF167 domain-containing protein [Polaromonas vacuolata]QJC57463.1 hypothetical protein HC248_02792 [Polaromonas vacuolata]